MQVVADNLSDSDPAVRRHAAREVLARAVPLPRSGTEVTVVNAIEVQTSATEVIRQRLDALRASLVAGTGTETIRGELAGGRDSARTPGEAEKE